MAGEGDSMQFVQSGGYGGLTLRCPVPAAEMSAEELAAIKAGAGRKTPAPRGPDRFQYDFVFEDAGGSRTATFHEGDVPDVLRGLIERLRAEARPG